MTVKRCLGHWDLKIHPHPDPLPSRTREHFLTFALSFCFLTFGFLFFSARCTVRRLTPKSSAMPLTLLPLRLSSTIRLFRAASLSRCCPLGSSSTHLDSGQLRQARKTSQPSSRQLISSGNKSNSLPTMTEQY